VHSMLFSKLTCVQLKRDTSVVLYNVPGATPATTLTLQPTP
jgi:hypothetical protein